jgi:hypothetical protein
VAKEVPLLINPNLEDPSDDLELEGETGVLKPRRLKNGRLSDRGRTTIALLDLNRTELVAERKRAYGDFLNVLDKLFNSAIDNPDAVDSRPYERQQLKDFRAGKLPYMLARRIAHQKYVLLARGAWSDRELGERLQPDGRPVDGRRPCLKQGRIGSSVGFRPWRVRRAFGRRESLRLS